MPSTTRLPISALHPIDEADRLNPQCEVEYVGDIYSYLREVEVKWPPVEPINIFHFFMKGGRNILSK